MKPNFILLILIVSSMSVNAAKWESAKSGSWSNGNNWLGGVAPAFTSSDTIVVKHFIYLGSNLTLNSGAYLQIDSTGGICGHQGIIVEKDASLLKYGTLELDSLVVPGGKVKLYIPGYVVLTQYGIISNGGSMNSNCALEVGPWFSCRNPIHNAVDDLLNTNSISLFPNPSSGIITILNTAPNSVFNLVTMDGKIVYQKTLTSNAEQIDISHFSSGIYFWKISAINNTLAEIGKLHLLR